MKHDEPQSILRLFVTRIAITGLDACGLVIMQV